MSITLYITVYVGNLFFKDLVAKAASLDLNPASNNGQRSLGLVFLNQNIIFV